MTVRVLFREYDQPARRQSRHLRWAEYFFLFVGLIALDAYIWVNLDSTFYQAYESWSFDQQVKGRSASFARFIASQLGIKSSVDAIPNDGNGASRSSEKPAAGTQAREQSSWAHAAKPKPLAVIGRIMVPRLQLSAMVREGVGDDILRRAVGHIPSTALPGQPGNVAFAGHRDTFFRKLRDIRKSDRIVVSTLHGDYDYQVESVQIVTPKDVSVLQAIPGEQALTLVTCFPFYYVGSAPKRFIVRAKQIDISQPQPQQTGS